MYIKWQTDRQSIYQILLINYIFKRPDVLQPTKTLIVLKFLMCMVMHWVCSNHLCQTSNIETRWTIFNFFNYDAVLGRDLNLLPYYATVTSNYCCMLFPKWRDLCLPYLANFLRGFVEINQISVFFPESDPALYSTLSAARDIFLAA